MAKKVHEVVSILERHGWEQVRERGSHKQFKRPGYTSVITVSGKRGATMPIGQLASIRRKAGIEELR
ncbi:MAG TPA: type II toxin-antitoxin system HicA family toxin [Solirubrobacteraceae bacterium]|nr:type II toxin-antitoxin system HicA family toxin [Solirubrobacteraceae bacterium]